MPQKQGPPPKKTEYTGEWKEMPRCTKCSHRRIFHYRGIAGNAGKGVTREIPVRCSIPGCGCPTYVTSLDETVSVTLSAADLASWAAHLTGYDMHDDIEGAEAPEA